jgi:hypothetical protein
MPLASLKKVPQPVTVKLDAYEMGAAMRVELEKLRDQLTPQQAYEWISDALDRRIAELQEERVPRIEFSVQAPCLW